MKQLIKVTYDNDRITVLARDLHEFLELEERFSKWFDRMIGYGFVENEDYTPYQKVHPQNKQEITDYQLTIEMAKEIAMIQRNEKGKQARQYFIECENRLKQQMTPELMMAQGLLAAQTIIKEKEQRIAELEPKGTYYDKILQCKGLINTTVIAKDYGYSAKEFNKLLHSLKIQFKQGRQWLLYSQYQNCGYTGSQTHKVENEKESFAVIDTKWTQKGRAFLYNILKKNGIVPSMERLDLFPEIESSNQSPVQA